MPENSPSVNTISNPAKILRALMKATGITCAKTLSEQLDIPVRTIRRLRLEVAQSDDAATTANAAISGTANAATTAISGRDDKKEIPPTPPKEKTTSPRTTVETYNTTQPREDALCGVDLKVLSDRLREAGAGCLDPNAGNLQVMSTPLGWMQDGADLEIDILPTLRAASVDKKGAMIRSWNYFDRAIAKAKADRNRKLPNVPATNVVPMPRQSEKAQRSAAFMAALKAPRIEVLT